MINITIDEHILKEIIALNKKNVEAIKDRDILNSEIAKRTERIKDLLLHLDSNVVLINQRRPRHEFR